MLLIGFIVCIAGKWLIFFIYEQVAGGRYPVIGDQKYDILHNRGIKCDNYMLNSHTLQNLSKMPGRANTEFVWFWILTMMSSY